MLILCNLEDRDQPIDYMGLNFGDRSNSYFEQPNTCLTIAALGFGCWTVARMLIWVLPRCLITIHFEHKLSKHSGMSCGLHGGFQTIGTLVACNLDAIN